MGFDISSAQPAEEPKKPGFDLASATPQRSPEEQRNIDKMGLAAGVGTGAAIGAWGTGRLLRWAFPGLQPSRSFLININKDLMRDFGGKGLRELYPQYTQSVMRSGKPVTFADWIADQSTRAPNTLRTINEAIDKGGPANVIAQNLERRGAGQKGRVLSDLAGALGVPQTSLEQTAEDFAKSKASNAKTLYSEAFRSKQPLMDQRLYDMFHDYGPIMEGALENAKEAFKYDPDKQIESQTVKALAGHRKDEWKWPLDAENVPPYLHVGEPKNQLQTVITPNIETLDRMKRALWNLQQKRTKEGAGDVGKVVEARRKLTDLLDEIGPKEYQQARKQYAGDTAIEEASDLGANLFKQDPSDLRMRLLKMSPDERTALARGFYGNLQSMNDPKFIREIVSGNPQYQKQRDLLSAVFPNTNQLHDFLGALSGEEAMRSGEKAFVNPGKAEPQEGFRPHIGGALGSQGRAHGYLFNALPMPPYNTRNVERAGVRMLFDEPQFDPGGFTLPNSGMIPEVNRQWPYGGNLLGGSGGVGWEVGAPAGAGALGALSPYLYDYFKSQNQ